MGIRTTIDYRSFKPGLEKPITTDEKVRANIYARARHLNGLFFLLQQITLENMEDHLEDVRLSLQNAAELGGLVNDTAFHDLEVLDEIAEEAKHESASN